MKKVLALMLALIMVLSLVACGGSNTDSETTTGKKSDSSSYEKDSKELSESEIKLKVEKAILEEVKSHYPDAEPYSTRYQIANKKTNGKYIDVYGTLTLYDKYGKVTTGYIDGSGSYTKSFEVNVSTEGYYDKCNIDGWLFTSLMYEW